MSNYYTIMKRMKQNITNGTEFCKTDNDIEEIKNSETLISHTNCDYCGREILAIWDKFNANNWFPYLGNMAKKINTYKYSPIIQIMKENDESLEKVWNNKLVNVHARIHSKNWGLRCMDGSIKLLCNDCFQKTYNRIQVKLKDESICAISVVKDRNETIESVMNEFNLEGTIIGKGGKF